MKDFLLPQVRARFSAGWLLICCDYPKSHRISEVFSQWLTAHQVFFWPFPSNTSTLMDPLDRKIFGILKKTRQTLLDLISSVYFSTRSVRLDLSTNSLHGCSSLMPPLQRACGFEKKLTDRTQILLVEHIFATHIEPKPYYVQEACQLAGLVPLNPDAVLSRCKTRKQRPSFDRFLPIPPPDMSRSVSSDLEHIHQLISDPAVSPLSKIREIRSLTTTSQTPDKILRNSMNEGPDRALLPGECDPGRAARVPSQRRCKSDRVLTLGELVIKANPSKKGTKRKLDVEPKSDSDSDNSSDSESVRIVF